METLDDVTDRVLSEYLEMPGLRLTAPQAQRLCGIDAATCQRVLHVLVSANFLCLNRDGHYMRLTTGRHVRSAKADLTFENRLKKVS